VVLIVILHQNNKAMEAKIDHNTETKPNVLYIEILLFSFIGFLVYLSVIVSGYIASRFDISTQKFNAVFLGLAVAGMLTFAICSYLTCFKNRKS